MLKIILVRHGNTAFNKGDESGSHFRGCRTDVPLVVKGLDQVRAVADRLATVNISAVYSSPLRRALQTAEPIARAHGLEVIPFDKLLGIDYGQWSGRPHKEVEREWPELFRQWWVEPHLVQFPEGGSLKVVHERATKGLQEIVARHDNEIVVLVSHNAVNKLLICSILGLPTSKFWRIRQDTCCIDRFDYKDGKYTVLTLNEVDHLPSRPAVLDALTGK